MKNTTVRPRTVLPGLLALLLLLSGAFATQAGADGDEREVHKRVIKIHRQCDQGDEECAEMKRHVVVHHGEGEAGAHGAPVWVQRLGDEDFTFIGGHGGFLGVELTPLTPELRSHFGVPEAAGVMISKVMPDTPAARAGLAVGDIVTEVGGETVASAGELARAIGSRESGEAVTLGLWRDGQYQTLSTTLEERKLHQRVAVRLHCEDGDDDCGPAFTFVHGDGFDCGDAEECEVRVECHDSDDCECTVNGEAADCQALHHAHGE